MTTESELAPTPPTAAPPETTHTPPINPSASRSTDSACPGVRDRTVRAVVWISAMILLLPILVFVYVFFIRNRLLKG